MRLDKHEHEWYSVRTPADTPFYTNPDDEMQLDYWSSEVRPALISTFNVAKDLSMATHAMKIRLVLARDELTRALKC